MVQSARDADGIAVIDGCEVCCAKKLLEHMEIEPTRHVVVTQLGIAKNYETRWPSECVVRVKEALRGPAAELCTQITAGNETCCR